MFTDPIFFSFLFMVLIVIIPLVTSTYFLFRPTICSKRGHHGPLKYIMPMSYQYGFTHAVYCETCKNTLYTKASKAEVIRDIKLSRKSQ